MYSTEVQNSSTDNDILSTFPEIMNRPTLSVNPNDNLFKIATFFAIGPSIYADGLVVVDRLLNNKKLIKDENIEKKEKNNESVLGRIGGKHIILNIISPWLIEPDSYYPQCLFAKKAVNIMEKITTDQIIGFKTSLNSVLEIFRKTKFAFIPIVESKNTSGKNNIISHKLRAFITVRDFLKLFTDTQKDNVSKNDKNDDFTTNIEEIKNIPVKENCSDLIIVKEDEFLTSAIDLMLNKGIRNLGITNYESKLLGVINDRNIIEFLLSRSLRTIAGCNQNVRKKNKSDTRKDSEIINQIRIKKNLKITPVRQINENMLIKNASKLLLDPRNPYLILKGGDRIVTPWDIVMKEYYLNQMK
ncbi:MAG: CBS domain-containing protein [Nitrososphaeraceae archaeon]